MQYSCSLKQTEETCNTTRFLALGFSIAQPWVLRNKSIDWRLILSLSFLPLFLLHLSTFQQNKSKYNIMRLQQINRVFFKKLSWWKFKEEKWISYSLVQLFIKAVLTTFIKLLKLTIPVASVGSFHLEWSLLKIILKWREKFGHQNNA